MKKSTSIPFDFNSWREGTMTFNFEQKGAYMTLLDAQYSKGGLTIEEIKTILNGGYERLWGVLKSKFVEEDGLWHNQRAKKERAKKEKPMAVKSAAPTSKEEKKTIQLPTELKEAFAAFLEMRVRINKPATEYAQELVKAELKRLCKGDVELAVAILNQSIVNSWRDVFPLNEKSAYLYKPKNGQQPTAPVLQSTLSIFNQKKP